MANNIEIHEIVLKSNSSELTKRKLFELLCDVWDLERIQYSDLKRTEIVYKRKN
jgi:hypothetical protein